MTAKRSEAPRRASSRESQKTTKEQHLLLNQYIDLDGDDANLNHRRKEFCSELFELPPKLQQQVLGQQSAKSLERLLETLMRFTNFDTGEPTHTTEINMIEREIARQSTFKQKPMSKNELKLLERELNAFVA